MKKFIEKYKIQLKLLLALTIGLLVLASALYFLIPMILNYPDETYGTNFQTEVENTVYWQQVSLISLAIFLIFVVIIFAKTKFLVDNKDLLDEPEKYSEKQINYVKEKLFNTPYSILILNIIIPSIALTVIHSFTIHQLGITTLKLFMLVVSFITLYVTAVFVYINSLFKKILINLPVTDLTDVKRSSIKKRLIFHIFPIIVASLLFITLLGYSKTAIEKGNSSFEAYSKSLKYFCEYSESNFDSIDDLIQKSKVNFELLNQNDIFFIRLPDGNFINRDYQQISFSNFFIKYLNELSEKNFGRVYEYYGIDSQSATYKVNINNETYTIGVYFNILSIDVLEYFLLAFIVLVIIDVIILLLFSNSFKYDITVISEKFTNISKTLNDEENNKLVATSNDEIGDLCKAYNEIEELTKNNQDMLIEKERLASLGQMIGGIAHNLKTPIFSISGGLEGLSDLIKEFDSSIEDPTVNDKDMHDIANDMKDWIIKLKEHVSYMSDVITAVKGQAVALSENNSDTFNIDELFKYVDILMKHELKNSLTDLNIENDVDNSVNIVGNINGLVQVINNIISNSIEAYTDEKNKIINLKASLSENKIIISIQDFGPGLDDEVKEKLFKEMITTKGKNGTGLGLFMSYSNIKAHYNGDLYFESTKGKGSTFYIEIPIQNQ